MIGYSVYVLQTAHILRMRFNMTAAHGRLPGPARLISLLKAYQCRSAIPRRPCQCHNHRRQGIEAHHWPSSKLYLILRCALQSRSGCMLHVADLGEDVGISRGEQCRHGGQRWHHCRALQRGQHPRRQPSVFAGPSQPYVAQSQLATWHPTRCTRPPIYHCCQVCMSGFKRLSARHKISVTRCAFL